MVIVDPELIEGIIDHSLLEAGLMAATVVPNLSNVSLCEDATNWSGNSLNLDTEVYIQGSGSITLTVRNSTQYASYTPGGTANLSGTDVHFYFWALSSVYAQLATFSSGGLRLQLETSTNNNATWYVAGSDTWLGNWKCFVVDLSSTPDETTGTLNLASVATYRIGFVNTALTRNVDNCWVDALRYGTGLTAYGSTAFDFGDIAAEDESTSNRYGIIQEQDGVYFVQGRLTIGDSGGSNACNFKSQDEVVVLAERPVTSNLYQINFVGNGTGSTDVQMGIKVGTGDTAVGRNGTIIQGASSNVSAAINFDGGNVNTLKIYGSTFRLISGGITGSSTTAGNSFEFIGNTIDQSGQFDPEGGMDLRNNTYSGTSDADASGAALLWNANIDVKNEAFIANAQQGGPGLISNFATTDVATGTDIITIPGHSFTDDDVVEFSTTTTLPSPLAAGTNYYIVGTSGNTFQVSLTQGGTAVNLTTTGTGTHTIQTVDTHAIQHDTADTSYTYDGLTFSGNDYDIENTANATNTDTYAESNQNTTQALGNGTVTGVGQTFSGDGNDLANAQFYLSKTGSPTGNATANIYAATGSSGSYTPTGSALATSENFDVSTVTGRLTLRELFFTGTDNITLSSGTQNYVVTLEYSGGDVSNYLNVGVDTTSPTHGGNLATYSGGSWSATSGTDVIFRVRTGALLTINATNGANPSQSKADNTGSPPGSTTVNNTVTLEITGVVQHTQCYIYNSSTGAQIFNVDATTNVSGDEYKAVNSAYNYSGDIAVTVRAREMGYLPFESNATINSSGLSVIAVWQVDPNWKLTVASETVQFVNSTSTITRGTGDFGTDGWLSVMSQVTVSGSTSNNGTYTVTGVSGSNITVSGSLTDEGPSSGITLTYTRRKPTW